MRSFRVFFGTVDTTNFQLWCSFAFLEIFVEP